MTMAHDFLHSSSSEINQRHVFVSTSFYLLLVACGEATCSSFIEHKKLLFFPTLPPIHRYTQNTSLHLSLLLSSANMNVAPPLSETTIRKHKLSIWNYFLRLSTKHDQTVGQKQATLQGFVSRLFSNDAIGTQISTQLSPILHTPGGRGTGTTSETKQLIETAILSALSTPIAPLATKVEYDSHIEIKQAALRKAAMESLESHLIGGVPAVRCPRSMAVQRLEEVMELIQVGRFGPAIIKMSSHWSPKDCMAILDRGMSLYLHALTDDTLLSDLELRHAVTQAVVTLAKSVADRAVEQRYMSAQKLQDQLLPLQVSLIKVL
jgi:hypothetical protein